MNPVEADIKVAISIYKKSDLNLWEFAEVAARVVGARVEGATQKLADGIGRSVDTVEAYCHSWRLWEKALQYAPVDSEMLREDLKIGHWCVVAKAWKRKEQPIELMDALNFLAQARLRNWSVETLRSKLPRPDSNSDFVRDVKRLAEMAKQKVINAPRFSATANLIVMNQIVRLVKLLVKLSERLEAG